METTPSSKLDPQDIARVSTATDPEDVNAHLSLGWVIIGMASSQHSEHGFSLTYHLGWPRSLGEPIDAPLTGWKKLAAEAAERKTEPGQEPPF